MNGNGLIEFEHFFRKYLHSAEGEEKRVLIIYILDRLNICIPLFNFGLAVHITQLGFGALWDVMTSSKDQK